MTEKKKVYINAMMIDEFKAVLEERGITELKCTVCEVTIESIEKVPAFKNTKDGVKMSCSKCYFTGKFGNG